MIILVSLLSHFVIRFSESFCKFITPKTSHFEPSAELLNSFSP